MALSSNDKILPGLTGDVPFHTIRLLRQQAGGIVRYKETHLFKEE